MRKDVTFAIAGALALLVVLVAYASLRSVATESVVAVPPSVVCADDSMICPDGSVVPRIAPGCDFAPCPSGSGTPDRVNASSSPSREADGKNDETRARVGSVLERGGVVIEVKRVSSDSRCPSDVVCIQAGTVVVDVSLKKENGSQDVSLTLGLPITFAGKRIALDSVDPKPLSDRPISPSDYLFGFSVTD